MKAEILKDDAWRDMLWIVGQAPVVVNEIELNGLFSFVSPMVSFSIYDLSEWYRPGGKWEVARGDTVRVLTGNGDSVEVFRGMVDREIEWRPRDGVLQFRAMGWLAAFRDIFAGNIQEHRTLDNPNGWVRGTYRYVKITEEKETDEATGKEINVKYVWHAWPYVFENILTESQKVGFSKEYVFDSMEALFSLEKKVVHIWEEIQLGLYKRREDKGLLLQVNMFDVATQLKDQINHHNSRHSLEFDPGEITGDFRVKLIDRVFGDVDYFIRTIGGEIRVYAAGWRSSDGEPASTDPNSSQRIEGPVEIYHIKNDVEAELKAELEFEWNESSIRSLWRSVMEEGGDKAGGTGYEIYRDKIYHTICRQRSYASSNRALFYQMWFWWDHIVLLGTQHKWRIQNVLEWIDVDLTNGEILDHRSMAWRPLGEYYPNLSMPWRGYMSDLYRSAAINPDESIGATNPIYYQTPGRPNERELTFEPTGFIYFILDGVMFFSGNLALDRMEFGFRDTRISEILLEIAKLTNSILSVDKDKKIYLVGRDYFVDERTINDGSIMAVDRRTADNWGEDIPDINSQIVANESYLDALRNYYNDEYYPAKEEIWELICRDTDEVLQVGLLDAIRFPDIGLSDDVTPAIVRRMEIREGEVTITASRESQ